MAVKSDVQMGWLDRIVDIHFGGNVLLFGWDFDAETSGPTGTVSTPLVFTSVTCAPLGWNNAEGDKLPVDDTILNPGPPTFAKGIRDAYPLYDATTLTTTSETVGITDWAVFHAWQAEPGGLTVFSLTQPGNPAHFLVPFEIDFTNSRSAPFDPSRDLCYTVPGLGHVWFRDRLNELNNFFPGIHDYEVQLETILASHTVTEQFDTYKRLQRRNIFVDFDQLATKVKNGLVTLQIDLVGAQFNCNAWCAIIKDETTWPLVTQPSSASFQLPLFNPPGVGPPDYTADTFDFKVLSSVGSEGASAHLRFQFVINTALKTITQSKSNL